MSVPSTSHASSLREATALTALALAYSNGLAWRAHKRGQVPEEAFRGVNLVVLGLLMGLAAFRRGGLREVGFKKEGLGRSLLGGLAVGVGLSAVPLFLIYRPILLDAPLEYGPISKMTRRELLRDLMWGVPVGIALFEELIFRGLLYSALERGRSPQFAVAGSAAAFAGWHFAVTYTSAAQSNIAGAAQLPRPLKPFVQPLAVLGGVLSTGLAGVAFGLLRRRTGNLAGPILAHYLVDSLLIVAIRRRSTPESL